jgi:pimeloyl-ACP methyl ester carboxylesterase
MAFFTTQDGARLHYQEIGRGDPTLVFVHGWCSNLDHWQRQVPHFAERHRLLLVDRRGHGQSSIPERDHSPAQHAHDLAGLMRARGIAAAVVVGHAGGGPSVLELAAQHPELVCACVFADAGLYRGVSLEQIVKAPAITRLRQADYLATFTRQYESYFHALSGSALAAKIAAEAARTPQQVIVDELTWIFRSDTIAMASRVKQPVLWTVSSESKATSASIREHLPQARFAQVVAAGHFLHLEVPEQWNPMLQRFVDSLPA